MRKNKIRLVTMLLLLATMSTLFASCGPDITAAAEESLLLAYEDTVVFNADDVSAVIDHYRESKVPYAVSEKKAKIIFPVAFDAANSTVMLVSCVDDTTPELEMRSYSSQEVPSSVDGNEVEVDVSWWYDADSNINQTTTWSYLIRVMDTEGVFHYYYFRVNYQNS